MKSRTQRSRNLQRSYMLPHRPPPPPFLLLSPSSHFFPLTSKTRRLVTFFNLQLQYLQEHNSFGGAVPLRVCSLATQALEWKDDRRQSASLPRPVVEVRVPRGPSAVEGERQLLVVLVFLAPHPKGGEHDLRTVLRFRTTRRSRAGAARGGGTPSSTSKVPGSSARRRT